VKWFNPLSYEVIARGKESAENARLVRPLLLMV
jgi:hypothetical protein